MNAQESPSETVTSQVNAALEGISADWRTILAKTLAKSLDSEPNASMARELRALMADIDSSREPEGTSVADDLRARRAARIANPKAS